MPCDKDQDKLVLTSLSCKGQSFICEPLAAEAKRCSSRSAAWAQDQRPHNSYCNATPEATRVVTVHSKNFQWT